MSASSAAKCAFSWLFAVVAMTPQVLAQQSARERLEKLNVRLKTDHYELAGTVDDVRLKQYAVALEAIYAEYSRAMAGFFETTHAPRDGRDARAKSDRARPRGSASESGNAGTEAADREHAAACEDDPEPKRFRVVILREPHEYSAFTREVMGIGSAEFSIGLFAPALDLLLILDQGNFDDTREVLFHEAFHQFLARYVPSAPVWLNEGLATHYGYARFERGQLSFRMPPAEKWQLVRKAISKKQHSDVCTVIGMGRTEFYDPAAVSLSGYRGVARTHVNYAQAYTLVHMMATDREGLKRLQAYLRDLAQAKLTAAASMDKHFPASFCEELTPAWIQYVNSRPETR